MAEDKPALTPQQKKALSYAKDRRNTYGQNAKAARRRIPLHKAQDIRAARHNDKVAVVTGDVDGVAPQPPRRRWKKAADEALGKVVAWKRSWRDRLNASAGRAGKAKGRAADPEA